MFGMMIGFLILLNLVLSVQSFEFWPRRFQNIGGVFLGGFGGLSTGIGSKKLAVGVVSSSNDLSGASRKESIGSEETNHVVADGISPEQQAKKDFIAKLFSTTSGVRDPTVGERSWINIMNLPSACRGNPLPNSRTVGPKLQLEQLVPIFMIMFTRNHQHTMLSCISPIASAIRRNNTVSLLTNKGLDFSNMNARQTFVSFKQFSDGCQQGTSSAELEDMKLAYLCMSFNAKCNQIVSCFGVLLLKLFTTNMQLTYGGERVIGWAVQDGYVKAGHSAIVNQRVVSVKSPHSMPSVVESVRRGLPLSPDEVTCMVCKIGNEAVHVWLTFVTESGRIFDLDLSAFQFGTLSPFPCIVPVLSAEPTAFNGMIDRDRVQPPNMPEFGENVHNLMEAHAKIINTIHGKDHCCAGDMKRHYSLTIERVMDVLLEPRGSELLAKCAANPDHFFWTVMESLPK